MPRPHAREAMTASRGARAHSRDQGLSRSSSSYSSISRSTSARRASALARARASALASDLAACASTNSSPPAAARATSRRATTSSARCAAASTNDRRLRLMILQKRFSSSGSSMISSGGDAGSCDAGAGGDNGSASRSAFAVRKGCLDGVEATDGGGAGVEAAAAEGGESVEDDASACRPRASLDRELGLRLDRWGASSLSSGRRPLAESVRSSTCCLCSNNASASDSSRVGAADCALGSLRGLGTPKDSHEAILLILDARPNKFGCARAVGFLRSVTFALGTGGTPSRQKPRPRTRSRWA